MVIYRPDLFLPQEYVSQALPQAVKSQSEDTSSTSNGSDPLQEPKGELAEEEPSTTRVLVAARNLKWENIHQITKDMLESEFKPTHLLPDKYIPADEEQDVIGQVLMVDLNKGDPLLRYQVHRNQARLIEDRTPLNQRAMAVKVDEVIGVAGFIKPYSRVDVLVTMPDREPPETLTVLRNVVVLAAGERGDRAEAPVMPDGTISSWSNNVKPSFVAEQSKGEKQAPTKVTVVTLQVSPSQAEKLALAASEGQLRLVLRNPLDKEPGKTQGIDLKTFLDAGRPNKRQGPPKQRVDVYKGSTFETQYVRKK